MVDVEAEDHHLLDKPARVWILRVAKVVVWVVYLFVLVALIMLLIAFFLRLFGASPDAGFTEWVYRSVDEIMEPFRGIFPTEQLSDRSVLDFSLLFAVIIYSIFALIVHGIVDWISRRLARLTAPPPPPQIVIAAPAAPVPMTTNVNVGPSPVADVVVPGTPAPPPAGHVPQGATPEASSWPPSSS